MERRATGGLYTEGKPNTTTITQDDQNLGFARQGVLCKSDNTVKVQKNSRIDMGKFGPQT